MVYTYTPTYYSSLHDSITSLCKNMLPFSSKKRRLTAAEHKLSKLQSDNLKWQQDSFHQIINLMGLLKEGILLETEVSAFRTHLLETLIASPPQHQQPVILRDKLLFLQELFLAKCISEDEYHSSKRPLFQRLAVQGAEIEARDVVIAGPRDQKDNTEEEWSVIDLRDEKSKETLHSKTKPKPTSAIKQIKEAASVLGFVSSSHKQNKHREGRSIFEIEAHKENPLSNKESETEAIVMQESIAVESTKVSGSNDKAKRRPFRTLFQKEQKEDCGGDNRFNSKGDNRFNSKEKASKSAKKQWGFDGLKKWKRNGSEDETAPLPLNTEWSDGEAYSGSLHLVSSPMGEGPDTKQIKKKLHSTGSASDFFIDKVLGDKIKKELSLIQTELSTTNPSLKFSDDQVEAISTKLPVDKADLNKFFPKSWCDRYGDVVLDVVKKEFKDHVGEMDDMKNAAREKHGTKSMGWTTFDDDGEENYHPNLFAHHNHHQDRSQTQTHAYANPFLHDNGDKPRHESSSTFPDQNPFWNNSQY